jgi:hypothetical protein
MSDPAITAWEPTRLRCGRVAATLLLLVIGLSPDAGASKKKAPPPPLPTEHRLSSGGFAFRTPESWKVVTTPENPDTLNAAGDGVAVRFVYHEGETGYDSFHGACMLERLAGAMEMEPVVQYEYDFVGGVIGDRRALDSAFVVTYDKPILGERQWRQRSVSIVGNGTSLCAVTYAPATLWKKSAPTRALLDAVLASVTFR